MIRKEIRYESTVADVPPATEAEVVERSRWTTWIAEGSFGSDEEESDSNDD